MSLQEKGYNTLETIATDLGVPSSILERLAHHGELAVVRRGETMWVHPHTLEQWQKRRMSRFLRAA